ncbi:HNH endonuclease [Longivirga aurantiaca]|uniref:HNH endonuclease n=1 Tax=Longivirga aurantiaca TaxID=1837743 RepID=UPI0036D8AE50
MAKLRDVLARTSRVEEELAARLAAYEALRASPNYPNLTSGEVRDSGAYGGQQGVWVDKTRTSALVASGVAVGLRHTGRHYADDLDESGIVYHYPKTRRAGSRDSGEVESIKAAERLRLPVFVISEEGAARRVHLGWVVDHDDAAGIALILFGDRAVAPMLRRDDEVDVFVRGAERRRRQAVASRLERDPTFAFNTIRKYGGSCALTGITVPSMLEAAHVIPVARGGSDHEGNAILLNAALHRAFDAFLWTLHPRTLDVVIRPQGPVAGAMRIEQLSLSGRPGPHRDALEWRMDQFQRQLGSAATAAL